MRHEAAWLLALAAACSDPAEPPPPADAGTDAPPPEPDAAVTGPAAPAPPVLTPCPAGWREVPGDVPTCAPFPADAPEACADDEAHFPGGPGCERLGTACPAGDWATDLPDGAVVWYVHPEGAADGDGSQESPFATIADAIEAASGGDVVALARGTYAESVELPERITLWGACVAQTLLTTDTPSGSAGVVTVVGGDTVVRNLTITGRGPGLWVEGRDASSDVEGAVIRGNDFVGLLVGSGGTVTGRSLAIRDIHGQDVPGSSGMGAIVDSRGALDLERVSIEDTDGTAIVAFGTHVALTDAVLRDGRLDDPPARGIEAMLGADVTLTRAWLSGQPDAAVLAFDLDTVITLEDTVVRDTAPGAGGLRGRGLSLVDGARGVVRRTLFEGQREVAVIADGDGTTLELEDVVIQGTRGSEADGTGGTGLAIQWAAAATATRVRLAGNRGAGLLVISDGTTATLTDVAVVGTLGLAEGGDQGTGIHLQGAVVQGTRILSADNRQAGVLAIEGGAVTLEDLTVEGTRERDCAADTCVGLGFGDGLVSSLGATVDVRRFRVSGSARVGVLLLDADLDLHEGEVTGCPIGASVQTEAFDVNRLYDGVLFRNNDRNLDRSTLPAPEPVSGF